MRKPGGASPGAGADPPTRPGNGPRSVMAIPPGVRDQEEKAHKEKAHSAVRLNGSVCCLSSSSTSAARLSGEPNEMQNLW